LAFKSWVPLVFEAFLDATSAVFVFSNFYWVDTVLEAALLAFSKSALFDAGVASD